MDSTKIFYSNTKEHTIVYNTITKRFEVVYLGKVISDFELAADAILAADLIENKAK